VPRANVVAANEAPPPRRISAIVARVSGKSRPGKGARRRSFLPLAIGAGGGVALATAAFWFFERQASYVLRGKADPTDERILDVVHSSESPTMGRAMRAVTHLGEHYCIGAAAGLTAFTLVRRGRHDEAWTVVISTGGAMIINTALKAIFRRQRPQNLARRIRLPNSHSFPSGHALLSAATYPIVVQHLAGESSLPARVAVHSLAATAILAVGFSRVYFGVHFPSDVLGGFTAGLGWLGMTSLSHSLFGQDDEHRS
jgi:undecaprenyl-diphosphatase